MKKIMFFGGAGHVGNLVVPLFTEDWQVHVYDLRPPQTSAAIYHAGDITDRDAVRAATQGMDVVVYMVMVPVDRLNDIALSYDLNLTGLHFVLEAAHDFGVGQTIYCSTGSVFDWRHHEDGAIHDDMTPVSPNVYGMTKWLGEQVCQWFSQLHGLAVTALRLYRPVGFEQWDQVHRESGDEPWSKIFTLDRDLARAMRLTLDAGFQGYHVMSISGDWEAATVDCARARELIGWEPTHWPTTA
jgi:nucleoside-diphosphate-sugar epimerase